MATKEELQELLTIARSEISKLQTFIDSVSSPPYGFAVIAETERTVVGADKKAATRVLANLGGQFMEVVVEDGIIPSPAVIKAGMLLKLNLQSKVPAAIMYNNLPGQVQTVKRRLDARTIELSGGQGSTATATSKTALCLDPVNPGDLVLLSPSGDVVIEVLGPDPSKQQQNVVSDFRPVEWADIGGLDDVKSFFHDIFERPLECPQVYRAYNLPTPKGALMFGPPGCGKTLIGRAFATDLARRYGRADGGGFMSVKGPEMLSMWVGQTEQNIRELFAKARKFKQDNGFPAVIFFDEAEAIMNKRGSGKSSDVDRTIVPAFLAEMDGLQDSGAIVLLATNRPEMLDPAIIREGRIDQKVHVPRPNATAAYRILLTNLKSYPIAHSHSLEGMAEAATEHLFSPEHTLYNIVLKDGSTKRFCLSHVLSGAMVAAIVQGAASAALTRDIAARSVTGITVSDIHDSIQSTLRQHRRMHYQDEVNEFIADYRDDVISLDRIVR